jgi:hypothetical protein
LKFISDTKWLSLITETYLESLDAHNNNQADDGIQTSHKLEFPKFDGSGDPLSWINRCERSFQVRHTSDHHWVGIATFYLLDDAQLWFHRMELNGGRPT